MIISNHQMDMLFQRYAIGTKLNLLKVEKKMDDARMREEKVNSNNIQNPQRVSPTHRS